MTKRIVRRNGLTIALVIIVLGLLCTVGVTHGAAVSVRPATDAPSH